MKLSDKIQSDVIEAMKAKDELKVSTLRMLNAAVKNFEIEKGGAGFSASEEDMLVIIQKQVKQRQDSIQSFKSGGRQELAQKEEKELKILQGYLPAMMSDEEIAKVVGLAIKETGASSPADIGQVMGKISGHLKGKADMTTVSKFVREKLSKD